MMQWQDGVFLEVSSQDFLSGLLVRLAQGGDDLAMVVQADATSFPAWATDVTMPIRSLGTT